MFRRAFARYTRVTGLVLLLGVAGGCAQTFDAATLGVEALMATPVDAQPQGEPFRLNRKAVYLVLGIIPVARPSLREELATQVTGNQRIANLRIRVRSRWTDILITALTGGLVVPRTVTYEGVVVGQE